MSEQIHSSYRRQKLENPPEDWHLTEWSCDKCRDTTWISLGKDADGVDRGVRRCECLERNAARARNEDRLPRAQIPAKYEKCRELDSFIFPPEPHPSREHLQRLVSVIRSYVQNFSPKLPDPRGLLIYGANGVGKTHLAVATLRLLLAQGYEGRFINYQALLRMIKGGYDQPFGGSRTDAYDEIAETEILLLDDVGSNRVTDWVQDTITDLISQRYDNARATIVTTNYPLHADKDCGVHTLADRIGERAASRLREMCRPLAMPALDDYRAKKSIGF